MSIKQACLLAGAICAAAIETNKPDTDAVDPENKDPNMDNETWEVYRRTQSLAVGFANALDPTNAKHWEWPAGIEGLDKGGGGQGELLAALNALVAQLKGGAPVPPPAGPPPAPVASMGTAK